MKIFHAGHGVLVLVALAACGPEKASDDSMTATSNQTSQTNQTGLTNDDTGEDPTDAGTVGGVTSTGEVEPTSGTTVAEATTSAPAELGIAGDFLLAVATTVDPGKPLQFIATSSGTEVDGALRVAICLQPLSLAQGKVTQPRQPTGERLCFEDVAIVDGGFTLDMETVMIGGMANPITGSDLVLSTILSATIKSDDLYCGRVTGEVLEPPVGSIEGSRFAAVRLADVSVLPDPVVIDCEGTTVTD